MSQSSLNATHLISHLDRFFNHWKKTKAWNNCEAIEVSLGSLQENNQRALSQSFHLWLLSYQLTQTTLVFTSRKSLIVLSSKPKIALFEAIKKKLEKSPALNAIHLIEKNKENESEGYEKLIDAMSAQNIQNVAIIEKEKSIPDGDYLHGWYHVLEREKFTLTDATQGFMQLFAIKSVEEADCIRKAARAVSKLQSNYLKNRIEEIIDEGSSINQHILAQDTEGALENPEKIENFPQDVEPEFLDVSFPPLIQSGGIYNIAQDSGSDENHLHFGTIVTLLGVQYRNYNALIGRTYMIDPTATQEKYYKLLQEMRQEALKNIKPNNPCSAVYLAVKNFVKKNHPELLDHLPESVGYGIGLLPNEPQLDFSEKNHAQIKAGMAFVVQVALVNIKETSPKYANNRQRKQYTLLLADTCLADQRALKILTKSEYKEVSYSLEDESSEDDITDGIDSSNIIERKARSSVLVTVGEDKRRQQLDALITKKRHEYALRGGGPLSGDDGDNKKSSFQTYDTFLAQGKIRSYAAPEKIPRNILKKNRIVVDSENATLLLPINGTHIPFHIATIKSVSTADEANHAHLRINFNTQATNFGKKYEPAVKFPNSTFIKEISFRSKDGRNINHVVKVIKDVRKRLKQLEREKQQRSTLVQQEKLRIIRGAYIPRIRDIYIRPNPKGKKTSGVLEAHVNGLRFIGEKGSRVYINYSNVKHAFFQKAEQDTIVLIHFHLVDGIMVGKRQQKDIQFYTEVMEEYDHLTGRGQRHQTDQESMREERRQILLKEKLNKEFREFAKKVEEKSQENDTPVDFETPYRDLEFVGTPHRSAVKLSPTVNCLVNLTEYPFFVLSLDDVECACFERVRFGLRHFDLVFVMKDYTKGVRMITSIPMKKLDLLKDWLLQVEIVYFEVSFSFKWDGIVDNVKVDPSWKPWEADGWKELLNTENMETGEEEEGEGGVVDEWRPDDDEDMYESDEYENPELHTVDEESEEEEAAEEDSDDEGKTWDELQEEAMREDERKRKREEQQYGGGGNPLKRRKY